MHLHALLKHFDHYTRLHVEVNSVRDQLVSLGIQDEIRFHFVDIKEDILRGLLYRYTRHNIPYGEPVRCSEICIAKSLPPEWRRLVAVKELLHITDTPEETAESEEAVEKLIRLLSLPMEVRNESRSSFNDRTHIIPALGILVPKDCRDLLRKPFNDGLITPSEIAHMAKIPERYAEIVMSDWFDDLLEGLRKINGVQKHSKNA